MAERDINTSTVALIGFIGTLIVFAIIILLQVAYLRWVSAREARDRQVPPAEWTGVRADQEARLKLPVPPQGTEPGSLPITTAMARVVAELQAGKPVREVSGRPVSRPTPPNSAAGGTPEAGPTVKSPSPQAPVEPPSEKQQP